MKHYPYHERRRFVHAFRITLHWTISLILMACSVDHSGGGGAGGSSIESGGGGGGGIVVNESDTIGDTRWNAPDGIEQVIAAPSNAVACTLGSQCPTGNCVDGFCCDSKCDNKCMACSVAKKGSGVDGICGSIAYDTDPDNDCPYGACDGKNVCKNYNGFGCTSTAECLSNYCVDGTCCGNICMGACQACSAAKKGGGTNGVCGNIAAGTNPDNECATGGTCNGSGTCSTSITKQANGAVCATSAQCTSGFCADGVCCDSWCLGTCQACTAAKKFGGVDGVCGPIANDKDPDEECWGGACNGVGLCKQYNGVPCNDKSQCLSGYCVDGFCCGNVCTGMCYACSEAKKGQGYDGVCGPMASGKDPENECNPGECNGSGTCNQPQTPQANGTTCVSGGQCASANCVDGYCCDTACTGTCVACSATKKGSGVNGTCGPIASETNPDNECNGGRCDGTGACRYYNGASCTASTQCFSNYCVDGYCCGNVCTGSCYACSAAKKGSGSDGACGPIGSGKDPDNECNPGECNGSGTCTQSQTPQANGTTCTTGVQCASGFCIDAVCCDAACNGTCVACSTAKKGSGTNGTCGPIQYDTDPDNECYAGSCSGSGTCQYYNGVACAATGDCLSHYCVDGFCCGNVCTGTCYACSAAKKGNGSDGACGPIAANLDPDDECGLTCNGAGACAKAGNGTTCNFAADCNSGFCVDGVCCDNACTGSCQACNVPGSLGTCSASCPAACTGTIGLPDPPISSSPIVGTSKNQGSNALPPSNNLSYPTNGHVLSAAIADFNTDGKPDVVVGSDSVSVMLGQGNGILGPRVDYPGAYRSVAVADFNSDGKPDIAAGPSGVGVWLNQGNGTFGARVDYTTATSDSSSVLAADLNGDGKPDLAVATYTYSVDQPFPGGQHIPSTNTVSILLNQGNGTFGPRTDVYFSGTSYSLGKGTSNYWLAAADFNGDGSKDLMYVYLDGRAVVLLVNQGNGTFTQGPSYSFQEPYTVVSGDLNGDGLPDIVVSNSGGASTYYVSVMLNQGNGSFAPKVDYVTSGAPFAIALVDLNGDGQLDLANTNDFGDNLNVRLNQGGGVFGTRFNYATGGTTPVPVMGADMNGDDRTDLVVGHAGSDNVTVLLNQCLP